MQILVAKDRFKLWDDDAEEKIDAAAMADVARACGCKFTQDQFKKICGAEYKPGKMGVRFLLFILGRISFRVQIYDPI